MPQDVASQLLGDEDPPREEVVHELLQRVSQMETTIPVEAVEHFLARGGASCNDKELSKLVAIATQKFIFDVATDAMEYCKHYKGDGYMKRKGGEEAITLTMEDLAASLKDRGIDVTKPEYFINSEEKD